MRIADKFYFKTGVEVEEVDAAVERLDMEGDGDYEWIVETFDEQMEKINLWKNSILIQNGSLIEFFMKISLFFMFGQM